VSAIESRIVAILRSRIESYLVQDLACDTCGTVAANHLQRDLCGGRIAASHVAADCVDLVDVFRGMARGMMVAGDCRGKRL